MKSSRPAVKSFPLVELGKRYFSVSQANDALVLVRRIVNDVSGHYENVLNCQEALEAGESWGTGENDREAQGEIIQRIEMLQACADELIDVGAELKDWATGQVDFPAMRGGREICLCWRRGDSAVDHWHEMNESCTARRRIESLPAEVY